MEQYHRSFSENEKWILGRGKVAEVDIAGKAARVAGSHTDITGRKRTEKELSKHRDHLEELVKERTKELEAAQEELLKREKIAVLGKVTATVSHELRKPLGTIRSSNFYLQRKFKQKDDKILKHLNRIDEQVEGCNSIVEDLLEYTRGRHVHAVESDIGPWLEELLDQLMEPEPITITKHLPNGAVRDHMDNFF